MNGVTTTLASGLGIPGRFDSQILFKGKPSSDVENGFFFIRQRVNLYRFEGDAWWGVEKGKKYSYPCQRWSEKEWQRFLFLFKYLCADYWNRQHPVWFVPPASFTALNVPFVRPTHRPNFQSVYEMDLRDFRRNPHLNPHMSVTVMRLKDSAPDFRSYVNRSAGQAVLTNRDLDETTHIHWGWLLPKDRHVQITALHENWHMLGGDHVGSRQQEHQCRKDTNAEICYGKNAGDRSELAGMGLRWMEVYDRPWRARIALHTNTNQNAWQASLKPVAPQPLSK